MDTKEVVETIIAMIESVGPADRTQLEQNILEFCQRRVQTVEEVRIATHAFERAIEKLSPQERWDVDKRLGILDWDGGCSHSPVLCEKCKTRWDAKWKEK